jgi:DNA-binding GntR family transcriptional regulator
VATLRRFHDSMALQYRKQDAAGFFRYSQKLRQAIVETSGNEVLLRVYRLLNGQAARARYLAHMSHSSRDEAMVEQDEIMLALEARAAERLAELLEDSLLNRAQHVLEAVSHAG